MSAQHRKYLIVGPSWVGDMVMAQSLCIDLKQRYPNALIDMLAPQWTAAMVDRMPEVNALVATDFQHGKLSIRARWRLGKSLRSANYTHAIVLPNSFKAALVPAIAKISHRSGFIGEQRWGLLNDIRKLDKQYLPMTVQRFIALGRAKDAVVVEPIKLPAPALKSEPADAKQALAELQLTTSQPVLALCPGAEFGPSKQWPAEQYAEVARAYLQRDWQVWLFGSKSDIDTCQKINRLLDEQAQILAGKTTLPQAVDLLSIAGLVISNDSGLMHIAAGLNKPLVAVYGSTDPGHTPPLSNQHRVAKINLDCAPCFERQCPLQHHNCMQQLSSELVLAKTQEVLEPSKHVAEST